MSSSRVFKDDPAFTPVSLINKEQQDQNQTSPTPESPQDNFGHDTQAQESVNSPPEQAPTAGEHSLPPAPDLDAIRAEGYTQGKLETEQAMEKGLQQTSLAFARACAEVDNLHKNLLEASRGDMINLVIALSKKIIGRELTTSRNIIVDTLQNAIELAIKHHEYDIWLNPADLETVEKLVPELIGSVQKLEHVTLKTDVDITPGGCRLDSSVCTVDATIEAQLETVRDFLDEKGPEYRPIDTPTDAPDS